VHALLATSIHAFLIVWSVLLAVQVQRRQTALPRDWRDAYSRPLPAAATARPQRSHSALPLIALIALSAQWPVPTDHAALRARCRDGPGDKTFNPTLLFAKGGFADQSWQNFGRCEVSEDGTATFTLRYASSGEVMYELVLKPTLPAGAVEEESSGPRKKARVS
jgi:hypothetical protein